MQNKWCTVQFLTTLWTMPSQCSQPTHPSFIFQHDAMWFEIPLWPVRVSCPGCVLSQVLVPPVSSLAGQHETLKSPWFRVRPTQQQLNHQCVNIIPVLNPKHSSVTVTGEKNQLSQPKSEQRYLKHNAANVGRILICLLLSCVLNRSECPHFPESLAIQIFLVALMEA